jgi:hypothetical protein
MDFGDQKTQLTILAIGAVVVGGIAVVVGSGSSTTTSGSPGISGQAASTIAQENEAANANASATTLGLATIAGSLATTQANNRTALVANAQNGQNSIALAQIASNTNEFDTSASEQVADTNAASDLQLGLREAGVQQDISNNQATEVQRAAGASETNSWLNFGGSLFSGLTSLFTGGFSFGNLFDFGGGSNGQNYSYANNGNSRSANSPFS